MKGVDTVLGSKGREFQPRIEGTTDTYVLPIFIPSFLDLTNGTRVGTEWGLLMMALTVYYGPLVMTAEWERTWSAYINRGIEPG